MHLKTNFSPNAPIFHGIFFLYGQERKISQFYSNSFFTFWRINKLKLFEEAGSPISSEKLLRNFSTMEKPIKLILIVSFPTQHFSTPVSKMPLEKLPQAGIIMMSTWESCQECSRSFAGCVCHSLTQCFSNCGLGPTRCTVNQIHVIISFLIL